MQIRLKYKYDIAISVAEEDSFVADALAVALKKRNIRFYYYKQQRAVNWGRHILNISMDTYKANAKYILLITSRHFVEKFWSHTELNISQALNKNKEPYLLQLRLDDSKLDGIGQHIVFEDWHNNADEIATVLQEKIKQRNRKINRKRTAILSSVVITPAFIIGILSLNRTGTSLLPPSNSIIQVQNPDTQFVKNTDTAKKVIAPVRPSEEKTTGSILQLKIPGDSLIIPGGTFDMGSIDGPTDEQPLHKVTLEKFAMSRTEVTVAQFRLYCNLTGKKIPALPYRGNTDNYPVVNITWSEAKAYCQWRDGRLPTEAEWEYAARGGQYTTYSGGNSAAYVAVYKTNSGGNADKVAHKNPNSFGLYDMSGNVAEWCADFYDADYYARSSDHHPHGPKSGTQRVLRGGAFDTPVKPENELRVTRRGYAEPDTRSVDIGFRVVWEVK
jgi:formylglycine-generating enzyme